MGERIDTLRAEPNLFIDSPGDYVCKHIVEQLKLVTQFTQIFDEFIDPYERQDYAIRNLPALRIYNEILRKESESSFIVGDIKCDVIFPPNVRREETQGLQDILTGAMLQQFRRPTFFEILSQLVPGLNELGRTFDVDKTLGLVLQEGETAPLSQITLNLRIDLRKWDDHLEETNRTKDEPFTETLGDLTYLASEIQALRDSNEQELSLNSEQNI